MKLESFLRLPRDVAKRTDLTPAAKLVMAALHGRAWGDKTTAWPSIPTIAEDIGVSETAVKDALRSLQKNGLVAVEHRKDPANPRRNLSSVYTLAHTGSESDPPSVEKRPTPGTEGDREVYKPEEDKLNKPKPIVKVYSEFDEDEVTKTLRRLYREAEETRMNETFEDYLRRTS